MFKYSTLLFVILLCACNSDYSTQTFKHKIQFINAGSNIDASVSLELNDKAKQPLSIKSINDSVFEINGSNDSVTIRFLMHDFKMDFGKVPADFINSESDFQIAIDQATSLTPHEWPIQGLNDYAVLQIQKGTDHYIQAIGIKGSNQIGINIERESH